MIDKFTILFSTFGVLYVIFRAAKLDRFMPWFETRSMYDQAQKLEAQRQQEAAAGRRPAFGPAGGAPR